MPVYKAIYSKTVTLSAEVRFTAEDLDAARAHAVRVINEPEDQFEAIEFEQDDVEESLVLVREVV